jgi:diguanylate cyclase (GGDEF)-like protein
LRSEVGLMGILIFQNDKSEQSEIRKLLNEGGHTQLRFVSNSEELMNLLGLLEPGDFKPSADTDLIIFDISNERDAIDVLRRIKEHASYSEIPMIIISSQSAPETLQMAFAYGASDFISKPYRNYEFLARVRSALIFKHETDRRKARERELLEVTRQLSDLNAVLNRLSLIDGLTSISNRRFFDQSMNQEWRVSYRNERPVSLILIDIDHFKIFNDNYGHQAGDQCIKQVAQIIRGCLRRPGDLVARYGGEEFACILPDTDLTGATFVADRINASIQAANISHGKSPTADRVTVSQGVVSCIPGPNLTREQFIEAADQALYLAKREGRNCLRSKHLEGKSSPEIKKAE